MHLAAVPLATQDYPHSDNKHKNWQ